MFVRAAVSKTYHDFGSLFANQEGSLVLNLGKSAAESAAEIRAAIDKVWPYPHKGATIDGECVEVVDEGDL